MQKQKIRQIDSKLKTLKTLENLKIPSIGWLKELRLALGMSLTQFSRRLSLSPQGGKEIENREVERNITLKSLDRAAEALDCKVIYAIVPKEGSLKKIVDSKILELSKSIVERGNLSMELEGQKLTKRSLKQAILDKKEELSFRFPKAIWD